MIFSVSWGFTIYYSFLCILTDLWILFRLIDATLLLDITRKDVSDVCPWLEAG